MLQTLSLKNFVLVDELKLEFSAGLTVLTGETGAGKSILVDAIGLLLGDRADQGVVAQGTQRAELAATLDPSKLPAVQTWLSEQDISNEFDEILLRRTIDISGKSRAWINGIQVTLAQLRELGERLINIQGQQVHQTLLHADTQRELLDAYAGVLPLACEVATLFRNWKQCAQALETALSNADSFNAERTQLQSQIDEVTSLCFQAHEWSELEAEQKRLRHITSLIEGVRRSLSALSDHDESCQSQLSATLRRLTPLADLDTSLNEVLTLLTATEAQLVDAVRVLQSYADGLEIDPGRLAEIESRMDAIFQLARKYRVPPEQLPEKLVAWHQRLADLTPCIALENLQMQVCEAEAQYRTRSYQLSLARKTAATTLTEKVTMALQQLAMGGSHFEIMLHPHTPQTYGLEQVVFQIATHLGGPTRALNKIASGGELSRISLALQVVTSQVSTVPTLVFDEVDVGIGGRVAEIVGHMLAQLGQKRQVLCITHLPQVAACGHQQFQVSKSLDGSGSSIRQLSELERVDEIARMLGGVAITETTRQHAREMLKTSPQRSTQGSTQDLVKTRSHTR